MLYKNHVKSGRGEGGYRNIKSDNSLH